MTTTYLIRHSKTLKVNNTCNVDNLQIQNEKLCLSIDGEQFANEKMSNDIFDNIEILYASNYVRTIQTAKYLAEKKDLYINVVSDLGERKMGISSWDELPKNFVRKQFLDENLKIGDGESQKEVRDRMNSAIFKIINDNKNKTIAVISHGTAISFFLKNWCDIELVNDKLRYCFKGKVLFDGSFNYCETFKLEFDDDNNLINIENMKLD